MNHWRMYHPEVPAFLCELAQTPALQRLRGVGMNCGCEYTSLPLFRSLKPYSRFDHSLGTALIVWHFTGDPAQAAAGLLHDIATPVFAHVIDFMNGDHLRQESTEAGTREMIDGSPELQAVLSGHGLATADVCDYHRYPIADNPSPRLSADRLEYTVGNLLNYGFRTVDEVRVFFDGVMPGEDESGRPELVFRDRETAGDFALGALQCAMVYAGDEDRFAMQQLADLLRYALDLGVLAADDLYRTEPAVIGRLRADSRTAPAWNRFRALCRVVRTASGDGLQVFAKKRFIDPMTAGQGRVSEHSPAFSDALGAFLSARQDVLLRGEYAVPADVDWRECP